MLIINIPQKHVRPNNLLKNNPSGFTHTIVSLSPLEKLARPEGHYPSWRNLGFFFLVVKVPKPETFTDSPATRVCLRVLKMNSTISWASFFGSPTFSNTSFTMSAFVIDFSSNSDSSIFTLCLDECLFTLFSYKHTTNPRLEIMAFT